jgi:hypothetical protein
VERYVGAVRSYIPRDEIARGDLRANRERLGGCCCLLSEVGEGSACIERSRGQGPARQGDEMRSEEGGTRARGLLPHGMGVPAVGGRADLTR